MVGGGKKTLDDFFPPKKPEMRAGRWCGGLAADHRPPDCSPDDSQSRAALPPSPLVLLRDSPLPRDCAAANAPAGTIMMRQGPLRRRGARAGAGASRTDHAGDALLGTSCYRLVRPFPIPSFVDGE